MTATADFSRKEGQREMALQTPPADLPTPEAMTLTRQIVSDLGQVFDAIDADIAAAQRTTSTRGRASLAAARIKLTRIRATFEPEFLEFFRKYGLLLEEAEAAQSKDGGR